MPNPPTPTHVPDTISHELADKHARGECGGKCVLCCQVGESLKSFKQFTEDVKDPFKELWSELVSYVRMHKRKAGYWSSKEVSEILECSPQAVRGYVEKLAPRFKERGIELTYSQSERTRSAIGHNAFGHRGRAYSSYIEARVLWKYIGKTVKEDAPANAAGTGAVAGLTGDPPVRKKKQDDWKQQVKERIEKALAVKVNEDGSATALSFPRKAVKEGIENNPDVAVFEVDSDRYRNARFGKNRYHRYSKYVGEDETGQKIREIGRTTKKDIILKDSASGTMQFFRRKGGKLT